jgi:hypothetical protein
MAALRQSFVSVGAFDEFFEINEKSLKVHPWFTTASGFFLSTLSDMLLRSDGERIELLPAYTGDNVSFKLLAKGGFTIEAVVKDGAVTRLDVSSVSKQMPKIFYRGKQIEANFSL